MKKIQSYKLVTPGDLNHHKSMYAGKGSEILIEASWVAGTILTKVDTLMCVSINKINYFKPVSAGDILFIESRIILMGKSSVMMFVEIKNGRKTSELFLNGFVTYVRVDENTKKPKAIEYKFKPNKNDENEMKLHEMALKLKKLGKLTQ